MEQTDAILVGRTRFGESSLIVQWCAPEVGLFRTMAKGALRPKSPLGQQIRAQVRERFYPSRPEWRIMSYRQSNQLIAEALAGLSSVG